MGVGRFDGGWIVEAAVRFKSLRYRPGPTHAGELLANCFQGDHLSLP